MGGHHKGGGDDDQHAGYGWLAFCAIGMISSLTIYGIALEYATSGERKLHEWSFVFVTTSIYSITAFIARSVAHRNIEIQYVSAIFNIYRINIHIS